MKQLNIGRWVVGDAGHLLCRRRFPLLFFVVALASGCDKPAGGLAPLPAIDLSVFEPVVREQLEAAQRAVEVAPLDAHANGRLGMLLDAYNWLDKASVCYGRATQLDPKGLRWWYYLGRIQAERGQTKAAVRSLESVLDGNDDYLPAILLLGELSLQQRNFQDGRAWFERGLRVSPRSAHALFGLGQVAFEEGDVEGAITHYLKALDLAPEYGRAAYQLAIAYRSRKDLKSANHYLARHRESQAVYPVPDPWLDELRALRRDADHVLKSANDFFKSGKFREAIGYYRMVLKLNPDLSQAEYNLGIALARLKKPAEAIPHFETFLLRYPENVDGHNNLGLCYFEMERYDEAIERFRKALAIEPGYYKAHFNLALAFDRKGQADEAVKAFLKTIAIVPGHTEAHFNLGLHRRKRGEHEAALEHFLEVLRARPDDRRVQYLLLGEMNRKMRDEGPGEFPMGRGAPYRRLAALLVEKGLFEAARAVLGRGLAEVRSDWRIAVDLAWLLATCSDVKLREPEKALQLIQRVCREAAPEDPAALDTLAAALAATGQFERASEVAASALRFAMAGKESPASRRPAEAIRERLELYKSGKPFHEGN